MGYQESFITTSNKKHFNDFIDRIKAIGKDYYEQNSTYPAHIVSIKENICSEFTNKPVLKKGKKYVYFVGERHLQRNAGMILNMPNTDCYTLKIVFSEEVDCTKIFDTGKHEDGTIYNGLSNKWLDAKKFEF